MNNLILIHGFLGNSLEFEALTESLSDKFNCITIDLNSAESFDLKSLSIFVKEKLDSLKISKAHFWGYSMGGRVLLEFYRNYPEMCESLTLESASPGMIDPVEKDNRVKMDTEWANLIRKDKNLFLYKWHSQGLFQGFKKLKSFPIYLSLREKTLSIHHAQMIMEASPGANPHHFDVIENIKVPTLALVGQFDQKYVQMWGKLIDQNPNLAIQIVENSSHVIHLENPKIAAAEFIKYQINFLKVK